MNIFDYRRKKDLNGRTTEFRRDNAPVVAPNRSNSSTTLTTPANRRSRPGRRIQNRAQDRWYYNQRLEAYRQEVIGPSNRNQPTVPLRAGEAPAEQRDRKEKYRKLLNDWFSGEIIRDVFHRHPLQIVYIARPVWLLLPLILLVSGASLFIPGLWLALVPALALLLAVLAWYVNDWFNDYLIVTDKRVVQLEKVSFLDKAKTEIPLDRVQEVKIASRRNAIEYLFQVGTVTIISSGRTQIVFERVHRPERIRQEIDTLRKSYVAARGSFRKDRMRNYLENKIWGAPLVNWNAEEEAREIEAIESPNWLEKTFPTRPIRDRQRREIVWYTHPWILFKRVLPVSLLIVALLVAGLFGLPLVYRLGSGPLNGLVSLVYIAGLLALSFALWYKYENWHNDRYIVGPEKIMDMVRLPFGFDETQGVIDIRNVQDIQYEQRGLMANLLDYGNVKITTIGGPGLEFKNIPDPDEVKDEVSRRKEILKYVDEEKQDRLTADFFATYRDILLHPQGAPPPGQPDNGYRPGLPDNDRPGRTPGPGPAL